MTPPTCFISYSWDSDEHRNWVRNLAERLQAAGVHTLLDQWDLKPGADVLRYMESSIATADFVVLVCTPSFGKKANSRKGGVGYEQAIVTAELFADMQTAKFIPILRQGPALDALPVYLQSRIYVDFADDKQFERSLEDLLRVVHGSPAFARPPLGVAPTFKSAVPGGSTSPAKATSKAAPGIVKQLIEFAYSGDGLNMLTKTQAAKWAEQWLQRHSASDFQLFAEVVRAITAKSGAPGDAELTADLAERFLSRHDEGDLAQFREYVDYAYSGDGLNLLTRLAAAEWALHQIGD